MDTEPVYTLKTSHKILTIRALFTLLQKILNFVLFCIFWGGVFFWGEGVEVGVSYLCGITLALLRSLGRRDCSHIVNERS